MLGMDPAEPHFADTQPIVRLDTSDARFVDIIHTNAKLFISGGKMIIIDTKFVRVPSSQNFVDFPMYR